ncbi:MAG: T9SS type A sorting domain-containing protein, partial [Bacteroidetes bacterium]|nr:T9SS type A sorting domain-containing protein [Bacteroidota bacterium]
PNNIKPGRHFLYVRSYADSAGKKGKWGLTQRTAFYVEDKILSGEYFFDVDPGLGNGTSFSITSPDDSILQNLSITTPNTLAPGRHFLYIRTKNQTQWSLASRREFYVLPSITKAEYFVDTDPGVGNGTAVTFSSPSDSVNQAFSVSTSNTLNPGKHALYFRTKQNGLWSLPARRDFFVLPSINTAEYFFDNDPGPGNGIALAVSPTDDSISENYSIPTTGLGGGNHALYIRTRLASGQWSIPARRDFYILSKIVAAEYFWDTDPGVGSGNPLAVSPQEDSIQENYTIKTPCLSPGMHYLYVRTKDEWGKWGLTQTDSINFVNPTILATASYPGPGPYGTPVKVLGSGGVGPYQYKQGSGTATPDSIFLVANNTTTTFAAIDTCGYSDTTTITTPTAPSMIAGDTSASGQVTLSSYRHWTYVLTAQGNIVAAVRDNGQNLGQVDISFYKNRLGTVRSFPGSGQKYLDRNWHINSAITPNIPIGLMLYAVDSEYLALKAADPLLLSKNDLKITKYDGANEDLDPSNNSGTYLKIVPDSVATFTGPSSSGDGYALAFSVNNFSEFYEARNSIVALGIQDVQLQATLEPKAVRLQWQTKLEQASLLHHLQRSTSGSDFEDIAQILPGSGTSNHYEFLDQQMQQGRVYYRVALAMQDGSYWFSPLVSVLRDGQYSWAVVPNPARDYFQVSGLEPGEELQLRDMSGKLRWQGKSTNAVVKVDIRDLANGNYVLSATMVDGSRQMQRLTIVR